MAGELTITVCGNLTDDPETRTLNNGNVVASFTIASNQRKFNRNTSQWENGDSVFMRCSAWKTLAQNVAQSLHKGMPVIAYGRLSQRSYTDNNGVKRTVMEMTVTDIGASLRHASVVVTRKQQDNNGYQGQSGDGFGNTSAWS